MSKYKGGGSGASELLSDAEATFYAAVDKATAIRQGALVGATPAQARTADITYHRAVKAALAVAGYPPGLSGISSAALTELTGGS